METKTKARKVPPPPESGKAPTALLPTEPFTSKEVDDSDAELETMSEGDSGVKDSTEEELERLVFGDFAGFRDEIRSHVRNTAAFNARDGQSPHVNGVEEEVDAQEQDLERVADADLFFLDSGPSILDQQDFLPTSHGDEDHDPTLGGNEAPVWVDSDDERMLVSLAGNPRLRKLRVTASEDLINGREYTKRLRQQFERLYPVPEWALPLSSSQKSTKRSKRRYMSTHASATDKMEVDSQSSASTCDSDSDSDAKAVFAAPLSRILQSASSLIATGSTVKHPRLRPEVINIQRLKDVGSPQPSSITSLAFHPTQPLLLTSGPSALISIFEIYPHHPFSPSDPHPRLTSLAIPHTPLRSVHFLPSPSSQSSVGSDTILLSARRRYYHTWSLPTGCITKIARLYGHADIQRSFEALQPSPCGRYIAVKNTDHRRGGAGVNLISATTHQWIAEARGVEDANGLAAFAWWRSGDGLTLVGSAGEVVEWSLVQRRAVGRWQDDGGVGTTVVALGGRVEHNGLGGDRWIAIGSTSGIVNLYDRLRWTIDTLQERPQPTKALGQLTTAISTLTFSGDGQLLVMASSMKKDALRLVHLPSCTVYRNWPTSATPLGRVTSVAFSAEDHEAKKERLLAVGNESGKVRLWEIRA